MFLVICFLLCPSVQDINAWLLVRGVWRNPWWFPHRDGKPAGGGAESTVARRGESVSAALIHLSESVIGWLAHPPYPLTPVPAWTYHAHHRRGSHTQVNRTKVTLRSSDKFSTQKTALTASLYLFTDTVFLRWGIGPSGPATRHSEMFWSARGWSPITCPMWFSGHCAVLPVTAHLPFAPLPWAIATWMSFELSMPGVWSSNWLCYMHKQTVGLLPQSFYLERFSSCVFISCIY